MYYPTKAFVSLVAASVGLMSLSVTVRHAASARRFVKRREILLYLCLATYMCFLAVAQGNTKPGADEAKKPGGDSEELGCAGVKRADVQPGKTISNIMPIFSEIVRSPCPDGFHPVYQKTNGGFYIFEMVLKGETVDEWTQMITVTGTQGNAENQNDTARSRLDPKANVFRNACPDTFAAKPLGPTTISGHPAFVAWISCGSATRGGSAHSESALIVSIKGTKDYYTIQWAESGPASNHPLTYDEAKWGDRLEKMNPMQICPVEPAPYPNCISKKPVTSIPVVTPVFSELVRFTPPEGFAVAREDAQDTRYMREMVPEGETVEIWTQMVTLKGDKGLSADPKLSPQLYLEKFEGNVKGWCGDAFAAKEIGPTTISGHDAYVAWMSCGTVKSGAWTQSQSFVIVAIRGTNALYRISWAERGPASSQPVVFDEAKWGDRLKKLNPIRICARIAGEVAPYPSCADQK